MSFCFLLYLWMPPQKNMQRGNWLGNGYLCIVNPTHVFCLLKASLNDSASVTVHWYWRWCLWTVKCKHCMKCILILEMIKMFLVLTPKTEWALTQWNVTCSFFLTPFKIPCYCHWIIAAWTNYYPDAQPSLTYTGPFQELNMSKSTDVVLPISFEGLKGSSWEVILDK